MQLSPHDCPRRVQLTYHRGLPNVSPNVTRWSIDIRFQDASVPTLRSHPGFVLGSDKPAADAAETFGAPLIATDDDWQAARPAQRFSEQPPNVSPGVKQMSATVAARSSPAPEGHQWAGLHEHADQLLGALQLERQRHKRIDRADGREATDFAE